MHGGSGSLTRSSKGSTSSSNLRSRAKSQSRVGALQLCTWMPEGDCTWRSTEWQCRAQVQSGSLVSLSSAEAAALAAISLERINQLGFKISAIPKEDEGPAKTEKSSRRRPTALLKKKAVTTSFIEMSNKLQGDNGVDDKPCFAVPLGQLVRTDTKVFGSESVYADVDSLHEMTYSIRFRSALEDHDEQEEDGRYGEDGNSWEVECDGSPSKKGLNRERTQSADLGAASNSLLGVMRKGASGYVNSQTIPRIRSGASTYSLALSDERTGPRVPRVVNTCLRYLYRYGPTTVGVFRVSSSKRRVRQLRELFDSGSLQIEKLLGVSDESSGVESEEETSGRWDNCPWPKEWDHWPKSGGGTHDVAQLLKEFFRDLPEPLMTRQLYSAFLSTLRLSRDIQLQAVVHLIRLLPVANRDTLWALLRLLRNICTHSQTKDDTSSGNKMDSNNLATVLGPNILRTNPTQSHSSGPKSFFVEKLERAEERSDVILLVRYLIDNFERLFSVSSHDMDAMYRRMLVEQPQQLDNLFTDRFLSSNCDAPPSRKLSRDDVFILDEHSSQQSHHHRERHRKTGERGILRRTFDRYETSRARQSSTESTYSVHGVSSKQRLNSGSSKDTSLTSLNEWDSQWNQGNYHAFVGATQTPPSITITYSQEAAKKTTQSRSKSKSRSKYDPEQRQQKTFSLKKSKSASALLSGILFGSFRRDSDTSPSPSIDDEEYTPHRRPSASTPFANMGFCRRRDLISSECRRPKER